MLLPMGVRKVPVLSPSKPLKTLGTPFNNSMATTGKVAISKFVRTALLQLLQEDSAAVVASVEALALEEALEVVVALAPVVGMVVDSVVVVAALEVALVALAVLLLLVTMLVLHPTRPIHLLTSRLLAANLARLSTSETSHGPRAMKILSSYSQPLAKSSAPKSSMSLTAVLVEQV